MATKTAKKKSTPKSTPKQLATAARRLTESAHSEVRETTAVLDRSLIALTKNMNLSQDTMESVAMLEEIRKMCEKSIKAFKDCAIEHKAVGGKTEFGRVSIVVKETARRNPKWKDNAANLAVKYAGYSSAEDYVKEVTEETTPSVSTSVKLTVSE